MDVLTSDLCDAHPGVAVAEPVFTSYGGVEAFFGPVATLKVFEDNALVRTALEEPGEGRVLVVDGGGSRRCALVGGNLARLGVTHGWAGIVVYGCVRDTAELRAAALGVKALAAHPRRSEKGLHSGQRHLALQFAGVRVEDGHWLYADADGIVVSPTAIHTAP